MNAPELLSRSRYAILCWFAFALPVIGQDGQAMFQSTGRLPTPWAYGYPYAITNNGEAIGTIHARGSPTNHEGFRWRPNKGIELLGRLAPTDNIYAVHATHDGRYIVGTSVAPGITVPVYWRDGDGPFRVFPQPLGVPATGDGISLNGVVISGNVYWGGLSNYEGYVLSKKHGFETTGYLGQGRQTGVGKLPPDGHVVYGSSVAPWGQEAIRWTRDDGLEALGDILGGTLRAALYACSNDGQVGVGFGTPGFDTEHVARWTGGSGWQDLGQGRAFGVSGDGWVIVGIRDGFDPAIIWNPIDGRRYVKDVLEQDFGINLTGWRLREATAISNNGRYIAGWGFNPGGTLDDIELWMAEIPPFCYADCDRSTSNGPDRPPVLDIFDFLCFGNKFMQRDPYANCNNDAHFDIFDFLCFLDAFEKGCWK